MLLASKHPGYFEGILQLRNPTEEIAGFVRAETERDGKAMIVKVERIKNGIDFYLSSQHYLRALGKKLKNKFAGELKFSKRLHTRDRVKGKEVYRVTVLFRMLPFKVGGVIKIAGRQLVVTRITNKVQTKDAQTGRIEWHRLDQLRAF